MKVTVKKALEHSAGPIGAQGNLAILGKRARKNQAEGTLQSYRTRQIYNPGNLKLVLR